MYKDAIGRLSRLVEAELLRLEAIYNFEHGPEFEIALCRLLRSALPSRYGICRGYLITSDNQIAADDIVIFDRDGSPTLRMLEQDDYSRKEYVPVEAVYAYIEAKHTVHLDLGEESSIFRACSQVASVKSLPRAGRPHEQITDDFTLKTDFLKLEIGKLCHPRIQNPIVGAIFSRYVAWGKQRREANELYNRPEINLGVDVALQPDLLILGNDMIGLPGKSDGKYINLTLFRGTTDNSIHLFVVKNRAIALGIVSLIHKLNTIRLNKIDWAPVITEQLNIRDPNKAKIG